MTVHACLYNHTVEEAVYINVMNSTTFGGSFRNYSLTEGSGWSSQPHDLPVDGSSTVIEVGL